MTLDRNERLQRGAELAALAGELTFLAHKVGDKESEAAVLLVGRLADIGSDVHRLTRVLAEDIVD